MRALLGFCVFCLVWLAGTVHAQDEEGRDEAEPGALPKERIVVRIRFEGNRRYTDEVLKEQIASKEGQPYDAGLIERDKRRLRELFAAVLNIEEHEVEGGVELVIQVVDKIIVGTVDYLGLARVRKDDFTGLMSTKKGRPLLDHALESDRRLLERLHREKGYHFAEVRYYRRETKKPDVEDVIFQVITGRRVKVYKVILDGARSVERKELLKIIKNSDRYRNQFLGLGTLINPSYYNRAAVDEDRRRIEVYYQREGWRDVKVVFDGVTFGANRKHATLRFRIDEGLRYRLESLDIEYAEGAEPAPVDRKALAPAELKKLAVIDPGDPFRLEDLNRTQREVSLRLWSRAYADSRIATIVTPDADKHTVAIRLMIEAGPKIRLGRLRFFGNKWTKDNVLRRQFRRGALPGDYLDIEALEGGRNRLMALRYFSVVRFGDGRGGYGLVRDPGAAEDVRDVEVEVEETDTRQFQIGAGVSTDGGAFAQLSVTWRNFDIRKPPDKFGDILGDEAFRGAGQNFTISLQPGSTFSSFAISFTDPAVRDSRYSLHVSVSRRLSLYDDYDQINDAAVVRVGRFLDRDFVWNLSLLWSIGQVILDDPEFDAPQNAIDQQGASTLHRLGFTLARTKRREVDAFLNGHVSTFSFEFVGGFLSGDWDMVKLSLEHRAGWRVFQLEDGGWNRILLRARTDWAAPFGSSDEVPIFERYFLGGRSLRGFGYREVGPRDNGRPTGGEFMLTVTLEYTYPITSREDSGFGLDLVFFIDQGALVTEAGDLSGQDWRVSAGFGLAIGFGGPAQPPLIIDFGWPIRERATDERQILSVAFARNF